MIASPQLAEPAPPPGPVAGSAVATRPSRWRRLVMAPVKYAIGVLLCTSWLLSVLAIGWTYRLMHRTTLKAWYRRSPRARRETSFRQFAAADPWLAAHARWPSWLLSLAPRPAGLSPSEQSTVSSDATPIRFARLRRALRTCLGGLWQNVRTGVPAIVNTWILTIPAGLIWMFSWDAGWNVSFDKVYEEAFINTAWGLVGILWFIATMCYVPMAQARQASTGDWRSFYDFRLNWRIARARAGASLGLAALYAAFSLPVVVLAVAPQFFPQIEGFQQHYESMSDAEMAGLLTAYFTWAAAYIFAAYVLLHLLAARIYAGGLLALLQQGKVSAEQLGPRERAVMEHLELLPVAPRDAQPRSVVAHVTWAARWTGGRLFRTLTAVALFAVWFLVAAQIYVGMFLNYRPITGWLNLPLIQLPWLKEIPTHLL